MVQLAQADDLRLRRADFDKLVSGMENVRAPLAEWVSEAEKVVEDARERANGSSLIGVPDSTRVRESISAALPTHNLDEMIFPAIDAFEKAAKEYNVAASTPALSSYVGTRATLAEDMARAVETGGMYVSGLRTFRDMWPVIGRETPRKDAS
jgi:hypothetical protein